MEGFGDGGIGGDGPNVAALALEDRLDDHRTNFFPGSSRSRVDLCKTTHRTTHPEHPHPASAASTANVHPADPGELLCAFNHL
jgi:hypothetical protein